MHAGAIAAAIVGSSSSDVDPIENMAISTKRSDLVNASLPKINLPIYDLERAKCDLNPSQPFARGRPKAQTVRYHSSHRDARDVEFVVSDDYKLSDVVGEGAYGVVAAGVHLPTGTQVAIKKICPFDRSLCFMRTLREIKLLKHFQHENIIGLLDVQRPRTLDELGEVYIVQELMAADLSRIIRSQELSDDHCQYFTYQILRALKALHSADVLHRDLKPGNLLVNGNCDLKVCDFGLARSANPHVAATMQTQMGFMTEYVATRWYRAPEIMLTFQHYTKAIDMWSVGCILAEMLGGLPLFPGKDYCDQLKLILEVVGSPPASTQRNIKSRRARAYVSKLPNYPKKDLSELFPRATPQSLDILDRLLAFDPENRITVEEALEHPYFARYHEPHDEPTVAKVPVHFFEFERDQNMSVDVMRQLIFEELNSEPSPQRSQYPSAAEVQTNNVANEVANQRALEQARDTQMRRQLYQQEREEAEIVGCLVKSPTLREQAERQIHKMTPEEAQQVAEALEPMQDLQRKGKGLFEMGEITPRASDIQTASPPPETPPVRTATEAEEEYEGLPSGPPTKELKRDPPMSAEDRLQARSSGSSSAT